MRRDHLNTLPVSVIVPARNEADTIARVVETMGAMPHVDEVVVVDNGSSDDTARVAQAADGRVVAEARPGMGHAIRAGFVAARNDWVMKVDADLDRFDTSLFGRMIEARAPGIGLIKGRWQDPRDPMPMTRYLVQPALRQMFPTLGTLEAPNSGLYAFDRSLIALPEIVGDYAADLDVMLRIHAAGAGVAEVDIGRLENNPRDPSHYAAMSDTIMAFFLKKRDQRITEEVVVLAESAVQVATGCLGRVAAHARAGGTATVYTRNPMSNAGRVLDEVLQPFPTAKVLPLADADTFQPLGVSQAVHILTSHPLTGQKDGVHMAEVIRDAVDVRARVLLMEVDAEGYPAAGMRADIGLDMSDGLAIKQAALALLGRGAADTPPREMFETHAPNAKPQP